MADSNVTKFPASTTLTVEQALASSGQADLKEVIIIGLDQNDELFIRSSRTTRRDALWLLEIAKHETIYGD